MEKITYSFLKHTYLFELPVRILTLSKQGDTAAVEFSDTIFHPQGGGQPSDVGLLKTNLTTYPILSAVNNRQTGKITYKLPEAAAEALKVGDQVLMQIDKDTRIRNAKLHSAGHLIDLAVSNLKLPWSPSKAYHFPDAPYVQYVGVCQDAAKTKDVLQKQIDRLFAQFSQNKVQIQNLTVEQAKSSNLIDEAFKGQNVRVVGMMHTKCPCAGTHVQKIGQIGKFLVSKIGKKGKNLRVSYNLL